MENMVTFTPLYAITKSMENLRFDKEDYFHVLVFYVLFYKRNKKHVFGLPIRYRNTRERLGELEIACGNSRLAGSCFHFNFSFSQTYTRVSIFLSINVYFCTPLPSNKRNSFQANNINNSFAYIAIPLPR